MLFMLAMIVVTGILVSFAISQSRKARAATETAVDRTQQSIEALSQRHIAEYDGRDDLTGADVRNFCREYLYEPEQGITVHIIHLIDSGNNGIVYRDATFLEAIKDPDNPLFIRGSSVWRCTVEQDDGAMCITFTQR